MAVGVILAATFWCGNWLARRTGSVGQFVAKWLFFQTVLFSIGVLCVRLVPVAIVGMTVVIVPVLLLAFPRSIRWFVTLLVTLVPCVAFLALRSAWEIYRIQEPVIAQGSFKNLSNHGSRVLLVVFDEMGQYVAFEHRPPGVRMPAFDRLLGEAIVATEAHPTGPHTLVSMPALLTGRAIREVKPISDRELRIRYLQAEHFESWAESSTVFSDAHALGMGTAMIGWYHPYCSILRDLDRCVHVKTGLSKGVYARGGIREKTLDVVSQIPPIVLTNWAKRRSDAADRETHDLEDSKLTAATKEGLVNFRSGLIVIHLAVPHPPAIHARGIYVPNLVVADRKLAEIRGIMENVGTWDSTTVLITSDHSWRPKLWKGSVHWTEPDMTCIEAVDDNRVPFIAKLPGQHVSSTYSRAFNVLLSRKLIYGLLTAEITTAESFKHWLDLHGNDVPVHAYESVEGF